MRFQLALFIMLFTAGAASAQENCLPFLSGDASTPVIEMRVNGKGPFFFVLDTAASGTTLDDAVVASLDLPRDAATEEAQGMGGSVNVHFYKVASIAFGALTLDHATVPAFPAPQLISHQISSLAGIDILGDRLIEWRGQRKCIVASTSGGRPAGEGWRQIDAVWLRPWKIMLPISVGAVDGIALLDTGAQNSVLNPAFADRLGLRRGSGRLRPAGEIFGIDGRPLSLSQSDVADVSIGAWRWSTRSVKIGDLPVFSRLGAADAPVMILGMDWLSGHDFAIDYGAQKVWLRAR